MHSIWCRNPSRVRAAHDVMYAATKRLASAATTSIGTGLSMTGQTDAASANRPAPASATAGSATRPEAAQERPMSRIGARSGTWMPWNVMLKPAKGAATSSTAPTQPPR